MKKKLLFVAASLLSNIAFADISTGVWVSPMTKVNLNQPYFIYSTHTYSAYNNTASPQYIAVCYTLIVCPDANPIYRKHQYICDTFSLKPGEYKADKKNIRVDFSYPFTGYCNVQGKTESAAWFHSVTVANGKLKVGNP